MPSLPRDLKSILVRLKQDRTLRRFLALASTFGIILSSLLVLPVYWSPYVRLQGSLLSVQMDCVPSEFSIDLRTKHTQIRRVRFVVRGSTDAKSYDLRRGTPPGGGGGRSDWSLPFDAQGYAVSNIKEWREYRTNMVVEFAQSPYVDVVGIETSRSQVLENIECEGGELSGVALQSRIDVGKSRLMRHIVIQDVASDWIRAGNDFAGMILIGGLVVSVMILVGQTAFGLRDLYVTSDDELMKEVHAQLKSFGRTKKVDIEDMIFGDCELLERRLSFARVMGPAIGFILTISSLIAGLHPAEQSLQNTFLFISSLQIALVATFMGLAVRIFAECAIRVHRHVRDRKFALSAKP